MSDVLKITSPVEIKNRIQNTPRQQPTDAVFDLTDPAATSKEPQKIKKAEEEGSRQALLKDLNREIYLPLLNRTKTQSDALRQLMLYARLAQVSSEIVEQDFLEDFFILPKELLAELLKREEAATVYKGEFFETLRTLAKNEGEPKLQEAILSILKYFDCHVNRSSSLQSVLTQSHGLMELLTQGDRQLLEQQTARLAGLADAGEDNYKSIIKSLKNELIPLLRGLAVNYPPADRVHDRITSIIHSIVRYDKGDLKLLENAFQQFAEEVKPLLPHLTDEDIADMKQTLLRDARVLREEFQGSEAEKTGEAKLAYIKEEKDPAALLSKAMDRSGSAGVAGAAQNLLLYMVQSESPMLALMHFMIPLRFLDEDTYGEFFIDKDCQERKGEAKEATNIFFTIQSDLYGTFEIDLLSRDRSIDLNIKCPEELVGAVKQTKLRFKEFIEAGGYHLAGYQVGEYKESEIILKRFPALGYRKAGLDVKI